MDDWEEFESWHEDLMAWERFQDELERIKGENTYDDLHDFKDITLLHFHSLSFIIFPTYLLPLYRNPNRRIAYD